MTVALVVELRNDQGDRLALRVVEKSIRLSVEDATRNAVEADLNAAEAEQLALHLMLLTARLKAMGGK